VLGDDASELADEVGMPAQREVGLDPLLEGAQPQLVEPCDLRRRERLVGELVQRRPPPHRERLAQDPGCLRRLSCRECLPAVVKQRLEPARVDRVRLDAQQVPGRARDATSRSLETTSFAWSNSSASSVRCRDPARSTCRPSSTSSNADDPQRGAEPEVRPRRLARVLPA
jgi:hypothetical protein